MIITASADGASEAITVNHLQNDFKVTVAIRPTADFDGTWSLQYNLSGDTWTTDEEATNQTGDFINFLLSPVRRVRLSIASRTVGSVDLETLQGA